MEKEVNNKNWGLIRNDNGEWISDEYAVFLTQMDAICLKSRAINTKNREKVAIKILEKSKITEKEDIERLIREMFILKNSII